MKRMLLKISLSVALFAASVSSYAVTILDIPTIPGESQRLNYEGAIDVISASGDFSRDSCGIITLLKSVDLASPALITAAVNGEILAEATLVFLKDSGDVRFQYLTMELQGVAVRSVSVEEPATGGEVVERVELAATSLLIEYTRQADDHSAGESVSTLVTCGKPKK